MLEDSSNEEITYLDFSKAYDRVDHTILIAKLNGMGISGKNYDLIKH